MIQKRISNLFKLSILIGVRQIWGLLCTLYLLTYQPYLTLKDLLVENKDKSQISLLVLTALLPAIVYGILRFIYDMWKWGRIIPALGDVFAGMAVIEVGIWMYLGYWILKVYRSQMMDLRSQKK